MIRSLIRCGALAGAIGLGACDLTVVNENNPETERVLASPKDVESLLGTQYLRWHAGVYGSSISNVRGMANVSSFETFSSLANNGQGQVISIPRPPFNNAVGNGFAPEHRRMYFILSEVARVTSNVLTKLDDPTFNLGSAGETAQNARARAFAEFLRGLSHGYLALIYDSASTVSPGQGTEDAGVLQGYQEVMDTALSALQQAIDAANLTVTGGNGFPLPATWLPSNTSFSAANFVRLARSYRARFRANLARTKAERDAANWDLVIADAQNGNTDDHYNLMNTTTGPFDAWMQQWNGFGLWHQMTPFVIGMADTSGSYADYIATPLDERQASATEPFILATPDLRYPQGATRAAQRLDMPHPNCATVPCKRYFRNRTTPDQLTGASWGWSQYDFIRYHPFNVNGASALNPAGTGAPRNGLLPYFLKAELDLLEAEGHLNKNNFAAAAALINKTRTLAGLPAITAFDGSSPVPGGNACVPKVPVGPSFNTIACGNMYEAMKYEKRIETQHTSFATWLLDGRGWGDIAEGTGVCWATPYEDLQARSKPGEVHEIYSAGGFATGNICTAVKGTYGW